MICTYLKLCIPRAKRRILLRMWTANFSIHEYLQGKFATEPWYWTKRRHKGYISSAVTDGDGSFGKSTIKSYYLH